MPTRTATRSTRTFGKTGNRKPFVRLHAEQSQHNGIISCTFDRDFVGQAARIHAAIAAEDSLAGQLLRVNRPP